MTSPQAACHHARMRSFLVIGAVLAVAACKPDPYGGPGYGGPVLGGGWGQPRVPTWVDQRGNIHTPYTTISPPEGGYGPQGRPPSFWGLTNPYRVNNDPGGGN